MHGLSGCNKLSDRYACPFKVLRQITLVTYHLKLPRHSRIGKPVWSGPLDEDSPTSVPPDPGDIDGQPAYTVNRLLRSRCLLGGFQYLVDWEGYGPEEQPWVLAWDILDPQLIWDLICTYSPSISHRLGRGAVLTGIQLLEVACKWGSVMSTLAASDTPMTMPTSFCFSAY